MSRCTHPGCPGAVDASGYCDICGDRQPPSQPRSVSGAAAAPVSAQGSHGRWSVGNLVSLPLMKFQAPLSRVLTELEVPEGRRLCGSCHHPVGRSYAGQAAQSTGFCAECGLPFSFRPRLKRGDRVGRYEVHGCIAYGGRGWVYLAWHPDLETWVALKGQIHQSDPQAARWAMEERNHLIALDHPNVVRILDYVTHVDAGSADRTSYIVMEYVNGRSLRDVVPGALPLDQVIAYGIEILAALEYLHGRGLLYCDMKPDNVMRTADWLKVIDLGAVRRIDDRSTALTWTRGFAPENEVRSQLVTVQYDIYAVGKTLNALFPTSEAQQDGPGVESFRRLVARATDERRAARFASAAEMSEQLWGVLREVVSPGTREERPQPSTLFGATPQLLDAGLGSVPPLETWTAASARETLAEAVDLHAGLPAPAAAAGSLPVPRPDPDDPAAGFLAGIGGLDPGRLTAKMETYRRDARGGAASVEVELSECRARLGLHERDQAAACLQRAEALLVSMAAHDWRIAWHWGLWALVAGRVDEARARFQDVYGLLPGEDAPRLALGYCAEQHDRPEVAEAHYEAVRRRDRSQVGAAFGLARTHLARGNRAGAVRVLDDVPESARHSDAARIAAVRVRSARLASGPPSHADLREAARRIPALYLDGGSARGESRQRLIAAVQQSALEVARREEAVEPEEWDDVLGDLTERGLRLLLERSFRDELAGQARSIEDHDVLVDLASAVRPRTLR